MNKFHDKPCPICDGPLTIRLETIDPMGTTMETDVECAEGHYFYRVAYGKVEEFFGGEDEPIFANTDYEEQHWAGYRELRSEKIAYYRSMHAAKTAITFIDGPWEIVESGGPQSHPMVYASGKCICSIAFWDKATPEEVAELRATARLIAAAPKLWSTLKNLLAFTCLSQYELTENAKAARGPYLDVVQREAREAIEEATSKTGASS